GPFEAGDGEVEDHEMVLVGDLFAPADEVAAEAVDAGLLTQLAEDRGGEGLAGLDPTAGDRPLPRRGPVTPAHHQQVLVVDHDGAHAHLGGARDGSRVLGHSPTGSSAPRRSRCTTMARATSPKDSKKFFVARLPGRAMLSMPKLPREVAHATTSSISSSPMPTDRAPAST